MIEAALFIAGLIVGGVICWLLAAIRWRAQAVQESGELRAQLGARDSLVAELRLQSAKQGESETALRAALSREEQTRVAAQTELQASIRSIEEQKQLLAEAQKQFKDAFAALSAEALKSNSTEFVRQAEDRIKPLSESLGRYEEQIRKIEEERQKAYAGVRQLVESIGCDNKNLQKETARLVTALRSPQVRGRWGELTLQRVIEVVGMSSHCDFTLQPATDTESGLRRPDMVIRLPGQRTIVVDAKTPLSGYLDALEAADEPARRDCMARHAGAVRSHLKSLSGKQYWSQFSPSPDFVVMFIPSESFFSAALEQDRDLIEEGFRNGVILATPTTLLALLRTIAHSWQQRDVAENAERIADAGRELFERVCKFAEHMARIGDGLKKATEAYNSASSSWQSRILPSGRRMIELGTMPSETEVPELPAVSEMPYNVANPLAKLAWASDPTT